MAEKLGRPRKPISAAYIEVEMVFTSNDDFQKFGKVKWARKSKTVHGRKWVSARWEDEEDPDPDGGVVAVFQYQHTCRNEGGQRGDSEKFFRAVCRAANVSLDDAGVLDVRLLHRIKFEEPVRERLPRRDVEAETAGDVAGEEAEEIALAVPALPVPETRMPLPTPGTAEWDVMIAAMEEKARRHRYS